MTLETRYGCKSIDIQKKYVDIQISKFFLEKLFEAPNNNSYECITVPDHITELGTPKFEEGDYNYENLSLVFERENVRPKLRSKRKQKILP